MGLEINEYGPCIVSKLAVEVSSVKFLLITLWCNDVQSEHTLKLAKVVLRQMFGLRPQYKQDNSPLAMQFIKITAQFILD